MLGFTHRRTPTDRGTMIALRATHTAHRVAHDVGYPELQEPPVRAAQPVDLYDPDRERVQPCFVPVDEFSKWLIVFFIATLLALIIGPFFLARL